MMIRVYIVINSICFLFGILISTELANAQPVDSSGVTVYSYFINSNPFNAEVYLKDSLLGLTPLRFVSEKKLSGNMVIKKKDYIDETFRLDNYNFNKGAEIFLKPVFGIGEKIVLKDRQTNFVKKRNLYGILTSGILALATGTIAYTTKEKANDFYNQYLDNRSQDKLDKSKRYDIYSGVSLALMQVSIAGLIYFIFLQ